MFFKCCELADAGSKVAYEGCSLDRSPVHKDGAGRPGWVPPPGVTFPQKTTMSTGQI